jgi:hypothetical protein
MFCDHCGKPLNAGVQYCTACGTRVLPGASVSLAQSVAIAPSDRVRRNIGLLGVLWAINGALRLLETFAFTFIGPILLPRIFGTHSWFGGDFPFRGFWPFSMGLAWISVLFGAFGLVHLVLAWGLSERKTWARPLGLIIGFLALLRFPLGTALGTYTLWVLLPEPSAREYAQMAVA